MNYVHHMGARRIFFQGWAMRGLKDGSPPAGSRGSSPVGAWERSPRSWHFLKMMYKYSVYWGCICIKTLFNISRVGGKCPLAHACGRPWFTNVFLVLTTQWTVKTNVRTGKADNSQTRSVATAADALMMTYVTAIASDDVAGRQHVEVFGRQCRQHWLPPVLVQPSFCMPSPS